MLCRLTERDTHTHIYAHTHTNPARAQWMDARQGAHTIDLSDHTLVGLVVNLPTTHLFGIYKSSHWCDTVTHCNTLLHAATHCTVLQRTATHRNTPQRTVLFGIYKSSHWCNTATHCNTLQHTVPYCNAPVRDLHGELLVQVDTRDVLHCNTPQRTATHCNTLQHAATH